jgi:hypothetical protein
VIFGVVWDWAMMHINNRIQFAKDTLTWVAPAIGIPGLRYFQDSRDQRNELFVRDASTYTLGALLFLGIYFGGKKLLARLFTGKPIKIQSLGKKQISFKFPWLSNDHREMIAFLAALMANITYAGIGAVQLSKWLGRGTTSASQALTPFSSQSNQKPTTFTF